MNLQAIITKRNNSTIDIDCTFDCESGSTDSHFASPALRVGSNDHRPLSRISTTILQLQNSALKREQERNLQQLFRACDYSLETRQRSSIDQLVERFEQNSCTPAFVCSPEVTERSKSPVLEPSGSLTPHIRDILGILGVDFQQSEFEPTTVTSQTQSNCHKLPFEYDSIMSNNLGVPEQENHPSVTIQEQIDSKSQEQPFRPVTLRRNQFGPSEASLVKPESSQVAVQGKIQQLRRNSRSSSDLHTRHIPERVRGEMEAEHGTNAESERAATPSKHSPDPMDVTVEEASNKHDTEGSGTAEATGSHGELSNTDKANKATEEQQTSVASQPSLLSPTPIEKFLPSQLIRETPPPTPEALNVPPVSPAAIPSAPQNTPALPDTLSQQVIPSDNIQQPLSNVTENPTAALAKTLPGNPLDELSRLKPDLSLPADVIEKPSKRRRAVRKVRKVVIRRRILAVLLGRELGNITHAQLRNVQGVTDAVAVPEIL